MPVPEPMGPLDPSDASEIARKPAARAGRGQSPGLVGPPLGQVEPKPKPLRIRWRMAGHRPDNADSSNADVSRAAKDASRGTAIQHTTDKQAEASSPGGLAVSTGSSLNGQGLNGGSSAGSPGVVGLHDPSATSSAGVGTVGGSSGPATRANRASFDAGELAVVCSHFDIGVIESVRAYSRGSGRAPKAVIKTDRGRFLLKRRPLGSHGTDRVAYTHALQRHLASRKYPLPQLVKTRTHQATFYVRDGSIYELFEFIAGDGYDGSLDATADAGRALAFFHRTLGSFVYDGYQPSWGTYHNATGLEPHLAEILKKLPGDETRVILDRLRTAYQDAAKRVEDLGYGNWPRQTIHGDWHPGNMLFRNARVVGVIDYDTARLAPRVVDIANGCLQFSITRSGNDPQQWPAPLDEGRFKRFCRGYDSVPDQVISTAELQALPWLMIEALIVESAVPIAATGSFAGLSGVGFLRMVDAKAAWLSGHATRLTQLVAE